MTVPTVLECPGLENPPNGMVTVMDNVPGGVAMYTCDSGYMLEGQGDRTCRRVGERDAQWGGVAPTCSRTFTQQTLLYREVSFIWRLRVSTAFKMSFIERCPLFGGCVLALHLKFPLFGGCVLALD